MRGADAGVAGATRGPSPVEGTRKGQRHVADVAEAQLPILLEASLDNQRCPCRHVVGQRRPVRFARQHRCQHVGDVVARKGPTAGQHLVEHRAERPDVGPLVDRRGRAPAPGSCRRRCRAAHRQPSSRGEVIVGDWVTPEAGAPAASTALARPKSSTLTVPSGRTLMLAGFKSRWTMPCSCAASRASAIWFASGRASPNGMRPAAMRSASVGPSTSSITSAWTAIGAFEAVNDRDVGMAERGERPGFALEARQAFGVLRDRLGQHLDRDLPPEVRVGGPIHLAHPAHADLGDDFIRADARAWLQRHMGRVGLYETHSARGAQTWPSAPRPL